MGYTHTQEKLREQDGGSDVMITEERSRRLQAGPLQFEVEYMFTVNGLDSDKCNRGDVL